MKYVEVDPLPEVCQKCVEEDCDECDYLGLRFVPSRRDELKIQREMKIRRIDELLEEIATINRELATLPEDEEE